MLTLYLTPASISYLNQLLLSMVITAYLSWRFFIQKRQRASKQEQLLVLFFLAITTLSLAFFLEVSFLPSERLVVVYLENTILGIMLIALLQYAYHFPQPSEQQRFERWLALIASSAYMLWEVKVAVDRFRLLQQGSVTYRPEYLDYAPAILFIWVIFAFLRSAIQNWKLPASRWFAIIFLIPLYLATLNVLRTYYQVSEPFYQINLSVGILLTLFFFALNYLAFKTESTSLLVKLSGAILTSVLAVFGVIAWLVTPVYAEQYRPGILDHRSIQFSPNARGGYDVTEVPFYFESDFGQKLAITDDSSGRSGYAQVDFIFPLFGKPYSQLFISNNGLVSFGEEMHFWDMEYHFSSIPAIFALGLDLNPETSVAGGIFLRREGARLVITYDRIKAFYYSQREYTFQLILYVDGRFEITTNGLPAGQQYYINDRPDASIWVTGVKPSQAPEQNTSLRNLLIHVGPEGLLDDQNRAFRQYVHNFLSPLASVIFFSSLVFLVGLPLLLNITLARPLRALLVGVAGFNEGQGRQQIPVQFNDEIGFLTSSFNSLTGQLDDLIQTLEARVAMRVADLQESEKQYRDLFELASDAIFIVRNADDAILQANNAAQVLYGYNGDELAAMRITDLSAETEASQNADRTLTTSTPTMYIPLSWQRKKDGSVFPVETSTRMILWQRESAHIAVIRDISERKKAADADEKFSYMLRNLIEVTIDLSLTPSFDELCRKAVELGCSKLGFDRLGLWFIDLDDPQYIIGSFGVDENGQIRDERNIRLIHSVHEVNKKLISDRTYIYYAENTPVYDEKAQVVGNADKAAVSLWDGNTIIGFLNTDNFVNHQTIDERQRELLMLYAQAIGHQGTIKRAQQKLELLAITDPLTDLLNRRSFFIEAEKLFARSKHPPYRLTIMMFDIDHFKIVNDKYGHQAGDAVLREIAARIRNNLRPTDLLGRYGGEEFIALLPRTSFSTIAKIADRLIRAVREPPIKSNGGEITVTTSIGIALLSDNVASLDDLLYLADQALYEAKQTGRNRWVVRLVEEKRENP